ncbi:uncharacterized protein LOC124441971 [Xenia sp. Carnegie-2017]|uniref:uncharacterized protein LOC124441971 n=1 Tax=Xenia sp. Carnegie-2017 TaxID=2897299 RepID=UPI001F04906D|nr:uncharacterized protein LOC124441971 [Xenia sp. Carnegie-2017]
MVLSLLTKFQHYVRNRKFLTVLMRLFQLLIIPRIMATVVFIIYDMRCMIREKTSVLNCSQNHKFGDALIWIGAWLLMSILSSLMLIIVFIFDDDFEIEKEKCKNIYKKVCVVNFVPRVMPQTKEVKKIERRKNLVLPQTEGSKEGGEKGSRWSK